MGDRRGLRARQKRKKARNKLVLWRLRRGLHHDIQRAEALHRRIFLPMIEATIGALRRAGLPTAPPAE